MLNVWNLGSMDMKEHDDAKEPYELHGNQQTQISHPVLHPGLSRPLAQPVHQSNNPRPPPQTQLHPGKETRPSVIESSQPHIIECT